MSAYQKDNGKWYCIFQINGERKHLLCKGATNKKEAEQMENAFKYKLQQQQNGVVPREERKMSVDKLCDKFLQYSELNKRSYKQDKSRVKVIREYFKRCKYINNIKLDDIEQFKRYLLSNGKKKITANRYLEVLARCSILQSVMTGQRRTLLSKMLSLYWRTITSLDVYHLKNKTNCLK